MLTDLLALVFIILFPALGLYVRYLILRTISVHVYRAIRRDARK